MTSEQGDKVIALLEAIARKIGARVPTKREMSADEVRAWGDLNRGPSRATVGDPGGDYPTSTVRSREDFFREGG